MGESRCILSLAVRKQSVCDCWIRTVQHCDPVAICSITKVLVSDCKYFLWFSKFLKEKQPQSQNKENDLFHHLSVFYFIYFFTSCIGTIVDPGSHRKRTRLGAALPVRLSGFRSRSLSWQLSPCRSCCGMFSRGWWREPVVSTVVVKEQQQWGSPRSGPELFRTRCRSLLTASCRRSWCVRCQRSRWGEWDWPDRKHCDTIKTDRVWKAHLHPRNTHRQNSSYV